MSKMNDPQFWGAVRGLLIALGGAVAGFGLMSAADWTVFVDRTLAVVVAVAGLIAIVWPMIQGWRSRSTKALAVTTGDLPGVAAVVMTTVEAANAIPSDKVIGPPMANLNPDPKVVPGQPGG